MTVQQFAQLELGIEAEMMDAERPRVHFSANGAQVADMGMGRAHATSAAATSIPGAMGLTTNGAGDSNSPNAEPDIQYVTLDQVAIILGLHKKTLARKINKAGSGAPQPAIEGGGGKAHQWIWSELLPWLRKQFNRRLPERFPNLHG